ncbi:MAG TPA: pyridoxal phosphate-dependent aminotransferase [Candidatus Polarisedimenticolaceae bacterium]|nr:pyridoxal phosphate-dependent aminotransferase [Candidatus Polarisedimenticolaceae bacterium]
MSGSRVVGSVYMDWAKRKQVAPHTLAVSGIMGLSWDELGATEADLALDGLVGYGHGPLLEAFAAKSKVGPERIVLASGTSGANHLALATLLADGGEVALESPVYEPVESLVRYLGAPVRAFPRRHENGFRIDPDDVARAVTPRTKAIVLSNLHNPSSAMVDEKTLRALGALADRVGAKVVADEVYLDAAFEAAAPSVASLGDAYVVTTSLTKVYGLGGLRAGWIVAEPGLAERMWSLKNLFGVNEANPAERLAVVALKKSDAILARTRRILDANRAVWDAFLAGRHDLEVERLPYGTTSFPRVLSGSADRLCEILRERYETSLVPGRFFGAGDHVRLGLCGDPGRFPAAIERLGAALDDLKRG